MADEQQQETTAPEAPAEQPQTTDDLLRAVLAEQQQHRAEVANLREELAASKQQPQVQQTAPSVALTPEDALAARMEEVGKHDFYCPGCGLLYDYQRQCTGRAESPHPPIEVKSTDELKEGDKSKHSAPEYAQA